MEAVTMDASGGGGIGKAAGELLQEMQKAQEELQKSDPLKGGGQAPSTSFDNVLQAQGMQGVQGVSPVTSTQHATQVSQAAQILQIAKLNANSPSTRVG